MKCFTTACLALIFLTSCQKELQNIPAIVKTATGKSIVTMSASMDDYYFGNDIGVKKDGVPVQMDLWQYNGNFIDSVERKMEIICYQLDANRDAKGDIMFSCTFKKPTFANNRYTGTGVWSISNSEGVLAKAFKTGEGTLTYYEQEPTEEDDPIFRNVEMTGYVLK